MNMPEYPGLQIPFGNAGEFNNLMHQRIIIE
jgi:hypothetical protein